MIDDATLDKYGVRMELTIIGITHPCEPFLTPNILNRNRFIQPAQHKQCEETSGHPYNPQDRRSYAQKISGGEGEWEHKN
ncbi:MAG: hypothetical protein WCH21_06085 [Bacteroidota bacterium]